MFSVDGRNYRDCIDVISTLADQANSQAEMQDSAHALLSRYCAHSHALLSGPPFLAAATVAAAEPAAKECIYRREIIPSDSSGGVLTDTQCDEKGRHLLDTKLFF